jgi:hypothetical protein
MIQRGHIVQPVDLAIGERRTGMYVVNGDFAVSEYVTTADVPRLSVDEIRELQDAHNVNMCDECDDWLDAEPDSGLTELSAEEYFRVYG